MNTDFSPFPILRTDRLVLRSLELDDAQAIQKLRSDARVNEFLDRAATNNLDEAVAFIKIIQKSVEEGDSMYWAITCDDVLIGTICLYNWDKKNDIAEIGYELKVDAQGKGYMSEAIRAVIYFAFKTMCVKTITAFPKQGNVKSIQLLEKNNFVLDNTFKFKSELDANGYLVYYFNSCSLSESRITLIAQEMIDMASLI